MYFIMLLKSEKGRHKKSRIGAALHNIVNQWYKSNKKLLENEFRRN